MWLKSHHWVDVPHTVYERRREMRVRESKHTVMLFDRRYYDIDSGKFKTDKLQTLYSQSLADLIQPEVQSYDHLDYLYKNRHKGWFVPKDNDFDAECAREDQLRIEREQREREKEEEGRRLFQKNREKLAEEKLKREREAYLAVQEEKRAQLARELEESQARSAAYAKQLAEAEARIKAQQQLRARIAHEQQYGSNVCNIRPNRWIPK